MIMKLTILLIISITFATALSPHNNIIIEENDNPPIQKLAEVIGSSRVRLDGNCKKAECNLGNFITDAIVDWNAHHFDNEVRWTDASIAIIEAGAIKSSIEKSEAGIALENIQSSLSMGSKIFVVEVLGSELKAALEHAVHRGAGYDEFLQVSGLFVVYNATRPTGDRVVKVEALCKDCIVPAMEPLEDSKQYRILMQEALANGSNGYDMFKGKTSRQITTLDVEMVADYLKKRSPIYPGTEWRITYSGAPNLKISILMFLCAIFLSVLGKKL